MHPFFVSRPAGYPNSIFRESLALKAGYAQMNDWSRLAVDPRRWKNSRPNNALHEYRCASDKALRARPVRSMIEKASVVGRSVRTTPSVLDKYLS